MRTLTERVADAADREGVYAMDMIRFPELLLKNRLPEHVPHNVAQSADELNRKLFHALKTKYEKQEANPYA